MIKGMASLSLTVFGVVTAASVALALNFSGMVLNDLGRPASNARVTLERLSEPGKGMSVVTDTTGTFSFLVTEVGKEKEPVPFKLYGNYPNPFNPGTRISYSIDQPAEVFLAIYNAIGQKVRTINEGYRTSGFYTLSWDGRSDAGQACSAGVYLYRLNAGNKAAASKMLMVDSASGSWISGGTISVAAYKGNEERLYTITVTHPDADPLTLGPMTLANPEGNVFTINRIVDKMQLISRNTYTRGSEWYHYTKPLHKVNITHNYYIDKYEVTAELFSRVMNHALSRGALNTDSLTIKNTEGTVQPLFRLDTPERETNICVEFKNGVFAPKPDRGRYPMTYVSWYGALFFCYERNLLEGYPQTIDLKNWTCDFDKKGYRLPSDAEWELAAEWTDRREYAFGPDPGEYHPANTQLNADGFDDELNPGGWFSPQGDSHDGVSDMSGNVYEYVWDWMEFYHQGWADSTLVNPTGPIKGYNKICRGGSAYGCFRASRVGDKANVSIDRMSQDIGFRSVREEE